MERIVRPTIAEMARRGMPFQGVLYAGLMIADGQARLVEYNVRFGDPECQVLMMRLGGQVLDLLLACAEGRLAQTPVTWADDHALTVVMAAQGYPGSYAKGTVIGGLQALPETSFQMTFHAGTADRDGAVVATGGRVLACTGRGATWPRRISAPMRWSTRSTGRRASAAATSAGARCEPMTKGRPRGGAGPWTPSGRSGQIGEYSPS